MSNNNQTVAPTSNNSNQSRRTQSQNKGVAWKRRKEEQQSPLDTQSNLNKHDACCLTKKILSEFEECYWWWRFSTDRLIKQNFNTSI